MYLCYLDESGCTGILPNANANIQPVFVLIGITFEHTSLPEITHRFLTLKQRHYPNLAPDGNKHLDWAMVEIKGADLRKMIRQENRNQRRFAINVIHETFKILEDYDAKLFGRIWVKPIGGNFAGQSVYTYSIQYLGATFQNLLKKQREVGILIADNRNPHLNKLVAHSIFTQKFKTDGDPYPLLSETSVFGVSHNHIGLQIADMIASAVLFPLATTLYCSNFLTNSIHVHPRYLDIKTRFGQRLREMQHRFQNNAGDWKGGLVVSDPLGEKHSGHLFQ